MGAGAGGGGSSFVVLHAETPSTIAIAKSARMDLLVLLIDRILCVGQNESRVEVPTPEGQDHPIGILWAQYVKRGCPPECGSASLLAVDIPSVGLSDFREHSISHPPHSDGHPP
jgi:hypothetical protein